MLNQLISMTGLRARQISRVVHDVIGARLISKITQIIQGPVVLPRVFGARRGLSHA